MIDVMNADSIIAKQIMDVLEQSRTKIEDVYYEHKDDADLEIDLFVEYGNDADKLTLELSKIPYTVATSQIRGHILVGRIVTLTVYNLAIKNSLIEMLRENKWCPNGG